MKFTTSHTGFFERRRRFARSCSYVVSPPRLTTKMSRLNFSSCFSAARIAASSESAATDAAIARALSGAQGRGESH